MVASAKWQMKQCWRKYSCGLKYLQFVLVLVHTVDIIYNTSLRAVNPPTHMPKNVAVRILEKELLQLSQSCCLAWNMREAPLDILVHSLNAFFSTVFKKMQYTLFFMRMFSLFMSSFYLAKNSLVVKKNANNNYLFLKMSVSVTWRLNLCFLIS